MPFNPQRITRSVLLSVLLAMAATAVFGADETQAAKGKAVDFSRDIRPILSDRCFFCHGPDANRREADLRLDLRDDAVAAGAIVPGKPEESPFIERLVHADPDEVMPPPKTKMPRFTDAEVDLFRRWIADGAEYRGHWSFVPLPKAMPGSGGEGRGRRVGAQPDRRLRPGKTRRLRAETGTGSAPRTLVAASDL